MNRIVCFLLLVFVVFTHRLHKAGGISPMSEEDMKNSKVLIVLKYIKVIP